MPILVTLDVMLAKRKLRLQDLSLRLDISLTNLSLLKTGNARGVRFNTLNNLCEELQCQPGDILTYVTPEEYEKLMGRKWEDNWA